MHDLLTDWPDLATMHSDWLLDTGVRATSTAQLTGVESGHDPRTSAADTTYEAFTRRWHGESLESDDSNAA